MGKYIKNAVMSKLAGALATLGAARAKLQGTEFKYGARPDGTERGVEGLVNDSITKLYEALHLLEVIDMEIQLTFSEEDLKYMRTKFEIENKEDLCSAVWECISTYMEM